MIHFIRHGEAAAGWGAHPDPGLSKKGHAQAQQVALQLPDTGVSAVYASPMQRCQETAIPFANRSGLRVITEPRVTEIPTPPEIADRVTWLRTLMAGTWDSAPAIVLDWRRALLDAVETLPDNSVVFSHFIAINAIVGHLENDQRVTVFRPDHCSMTRLERSEEGLRLAERGNEAGTRVL